MAKNSELLKLKAEAKDLGIPFDEKVKEDELKKIIDDFKESANANNNEVIAETNEVQTVKAKTIEYCEKLQKEGWTVKEVTNTENGKEYLLIK